MMKKILLLPFFVVLLSFGVFALLDSDPDLLGLWHLDETSGNLLDTKTNGRPALDMVYPLGDYEEPPLFAFSTNSVGFDGSQNSASTRGIINTADAINDGTIYFNKTTGFTVGAGTNLSSIGDRGVMGSNDGGARGWQMRHSGDPNVFCRWFDPTGAGHLALVAGAFFNTRVVCVFNNTGVFLYLNGTLRASDINSLDIHHGDANFSIGSLGDKLGVYATPFIGDIDEAYFINRSLTPSEIIDVDTDGFESSAVPLVNSSWNVTSDVFSNGIRTNWNNGSLVNFSVTTIDLAIISLTVTTSVSSNMSCSLTENNYSSMVDADPLSKSATTETTSHSYTLSDNFTSEGADCVFCSFIQSDGVESAGGVSDSGCLNVFVNTQPVNNSFPNPASFSTVSGLTLIDWDAFTDVNLHTYEISLLNDIVGIAAANFTNFWRFDEGSGIVATPSRGNVDGSIAGAVYINPLGGSGTGPFALSFDGINDGVLLTNNSVGNFQKVDSWSITFWANWTEPTFNTIINKQANTGNNQGWLVSAEATGEVTFLITGDNAPLFRMRTRSSASFNDGTWRHFAFTYNGSQDVSGMITYVDAVAVGTVVVNNNIGASTITNNEFLTFGSRHNADLFWQGSLDEVGLVNRVLTPTEITDLFNDGLVNATSVINTTFIGNTSSGVTQLNFNFSQVSINTNYTVNVRGYDDFDLFNSVFNSFVLNELFIPPLPPGFFNVTLLSPDNVTFGAGDLPINFTWRIDSNGSVNSSCSLFIDDDIVENFTVNTTGNQSNLFSVPLVNASFLWNVTCVFGVALNAPFTFSFVEAPVNPPSNIIFNIEDCPDTLAEVFIYIFFVLLFFGLYILGFFILRLISFFTSIVLILIAVASFSCIGALASVFLTAICCFLFIFSMWGFE